MRRLVLSLTVVLFALVPAGASADTLYELTLDGQPSLDAAVAAGGVVRHIGARRALVEGREGLDAALGRAGFVCEPVIRLDGVGGELHLCAPARGAALSRYGNVVWSEPWGEVLVLVRADAVPDLQAACFAACRLPRSIVASGWFDSAPPAHVARAARDRRSVRGLVDDVMGSVSADSLAAHIDRLALHGDGSSRTRYVLREECLTEAREYIRSALASALPAGAAVDTQRFQIYRYTCDGPTSPAANFPADNVVGVLEGDGTLGGCYIVSAHYDATAQRSFRDGYYWWCDNPAPGANDDGTGVAVVLETARALSGVALPFDVRFVLVSGEELGLLGSDFYAAGAAAGHDTIYGVVNVDMVGYEPDRAQRDTCHIVTNPGSRWLADWMLETEATHAAAFPEWDAERAESLTVFSDHMSFWTRGYDAVWMFEHSRALDRDPTYHTLEDVPDSVSISQVTGVARLVAGSLAALADPDSEFNLAVFEEDVEFDEDAVQADAAASFVVDVHAFGPVEHVDATVRVWDGEPDEGDLLCEEPISRPVGGGEVIRVEFEWQPGAADVGPHDLNVEVLAPGTDELTLSDNRVTVPVYVLAPSLTLAGHFVYPNPARSLDEAALRYELTREARAVVVTVFDLTGQEVASLTRTRDVSAGDEENEGVLAGWNTLPWVALECPHPPPSGVYVYRIEVFAPDGGGSVDVETGRFALLR